MEENTRRLEDIYIKFRSRLKQFISRRLDDELTAEDVLHDVFLKIHANIDSLRDETKLESWVFQIARNVILDRLRSRREVHGAVDDLPAPDVTDEPSKKIAAGLGEMILLLPEPYREALLLSELHDIPQREIAQRFGISVSGAKSRVQRGRKMLKDLLLGCCHFEFDQLGTMIDYHPRDCSACSDSC